MKIIFSIFIILIINHSIFSAWEPIKSKKHMVSTADKFATQIGLEVLEKGGNAVDAAVAVGFALAVTYPRAGNIGGGGFMLIRLKDNSIFSLDYREKAPGLAHKDMYLDKEGNVIKNLSLIGYLASGVPGTVCGLYDAHERFGQLSWSELVQPAVDLAEKGFILDRYNSEAISSNIDVFSQFSSSKNIFINNGKPFKEGDLFIQKDLAKTLKKISDNGKNDFYFGEIASLIAKDMANHSGLINEKDLAKYTSVWRDPIKFTYRDYTIYSMGPPSSGGIILAEILNTIENYDIYKLSHNSSQMIHLWAETEKLAYADRATYLGDTDFITIPIKQMISDRYGLQQFQKIDPYFSIPSKDIGNFNFIDSESNETTHFSIVDKWGNAVSNTYTLNGSFGSGVVIQNTGILMNNEMDDFSSKPGTANLYGLIGNEKNSIQPYKRMLSSMTPTIITKDDSLFLVLGTPGGATIITSVAQVISNIVDHEMNVRQAVEAPRFHHQWLPDEIKMERNKFSSDVKYALNKMGHKLNYVENIGDIQAIIWNSEYSEWQGWSDPRGNGVTKGD